MRIPLLCLFHCSKVAGSSTVSFGGLDVTSDVKVPQLLLTIEQSSRRDGLRWTLGLLNFQSLTYLQEILSPSLCLPLLKVWFLAGKYALL